uniref:Uncharacterized protein n=1 Tax=Anguilla anguilla TaxID=7936 RepID=A0A0E9RM81_ANGAN
MNTYKTVKLTNQCFMNNECRPSVCYIVVSLAYTKYPILKYMHSR